ncbi:hypothetical protein HK104_002389 [Borealophlyctis nickersoniae]|nr:hypothetical protein HK104_002389 [Borealophlyctis nickersoniae]
MFIKPVQKLAPRALFFARPALRTFYLPLLRGSGRWRGFRIGDDEVVRTSGRDMKSGGKEKDAGPGELRSRTTAASAEEEDENNTQTQPAPLQAGYVEIISHRKALLQKELAELGWVAEQLRTVQMGVGVGVGAGAGEESVSSSTASTSSFGGEQQQQQRDVVTPAPAHVSPNTANAIHTPPTSAETPFTSAHSPSLSSLPPEPVLDNIHHPLPSLLCSETSDQDPSLSEASSALGDSWSDGSCRVGSDVLSRRTQLLSNIVKRGERAAQSWKYGTARFCEGLRGYSTVPADASEDSVIPTVVDGVELTRLGIRNYGKLEAVYGTPLPEGELVRRKNCTLCDAALDWRLNGYINRGPEGDAFQYKCYCRVCINAEKDKRMEDSKAGIKCFDCKQTTGLVKMGNYWFCSRHAAGTKARIKEKYQLSKTGQYCYSCSRVDGLQKYRGKSFCPTHLEAYKVTMARKLTKQPKPSSSISAHLLEDASRMAKHMPPNGLLLVDSYIVVDTELRKGKFSSTKWGNVAEVCAIHVVAGEVKRELHWDEENAVNLPLFSLMNGLSFRKVVWYYASNQCDYLRMSTLLGDASSIPWQDATTTISRHIISTDPTSTDKPYARSRSLKHIDEAMLFDFETRLVNGNMNLGPNPRKVRKDVEILWRLILLAKYIVAKGESAGREREADGGVDGQ